VIVPRRRGKILEVPNLFDSTLLQKPQCRLAELTNLVETNAYGAVKRATVLGIPGQYKASRLQQCERHKCVASVCWHYDTGDTSVVLDGNSLK